MYQLFYIKRTHKRTGLSEYSGEDFDERWDTDRTKLTAYENYDYAVNRCKQLFSNTDYYFIVVYFVLN